MSSRPSGFEAGQLLLLVIIINDRQRKLFGQLPIFHVLMWATSFPCPHALLERGQSTMSKEKGQTLVEFALILPVLLLAIFIIVESGRMFQAYITVQHAAREGARYAVTGRWNEEFAGEPDPRVASIADVARNALAGLSLAGPAGYDATGRILVGHYEIKVFGQNPDNPSQLLEGYAGLPNQKMAVQVAYRLEIITPVLNAIAPSVEVRGYQEMINEDFGQFGGGGFAGLREPPSPIPPEIPTAGASPTPTNTPTGTVTPTPTETGTPTQTPTVTSTPACAVQIVEPVYAANSTVTVRGDPGDTVILRDMNAGAIEIGRGVVGGSGYCNGSVAITVNLTSRNGHIIAALSTRYPSSDTACVGVTACWPTATPTATFTPTPTRTPTPAGPYIFLDAYCFLQEGQPTNITVYGRNWTPSASKTILVQWDGTVKTSFASRATWDTVINISASEATSGTHTVRASLLQPPNDEYSVDVLVPCPPTPTPTLTVTPLRPDLRITDIDVSPSSPITAYVPVTFTVDIINDGPGDALSLFWVDLYVDPSPAPPTADQADGDVTWKAVSSLGAGNTNSVILYYSFAVSGTHVVYGYVDAHTDVDERIEDNNFSQPLTLTITAGTPPTATLTTDPVCGAVGASATITVSGENWRTDQGPITIRWNSADKGLVDPPQTNWTRVITIEVGEATSEDHTISAQTSGTVVTSTYYIDCSRVGAIDGYTWIFIEGRVVPQERADVYCLDASGNLIATATSDDSAHYIMDGLPPGSGYTVIGQTYIDDVWYMDTQAGVQVSAGSTTRVNLVLLP
jgi:hypothetical protein